MVAEAIEQIVYNAIALTVSSSVHLRRKLCVEISLVALGVRTAYLLDLFLVPQDVALNLAKRLHNHDYPSLKNLRVLYHRDLSQVFFLNTKMLRDRISEARTTMPWTAFIHLTPEPELHFDAPTDIVSACETALTASSPFDCSITSLPPSQAIGLAGFLLEYPFSYLPTDDAQQDFLQGVPLCVVECLLVSRCSSEHTLMKFSYPLSIQEGELYKGSLGVADRIKNRFEQRISTSETEWMKIRISCSNVTLDRVAL